jgi:hypothetical protein
MRTNTVAIYNHDQVKEILRELAEQLLPLLRPGNRLIQTQINFIRRINPPLLLLLVDGRGQASRRSIIPLDGFGVRRELRHYVRACLGIT